MCLWSKVQVYLDSINNHNFSQIFLVSTPVWSVDTTLSRYIFWDQLFKKILNFIKMLDIFYGWFILIILEIPEIFSFFSFFLFFFFLSHTSFFFKPHFILVENLKIWMFMIVQYKLIVLRISNFWISSKETKYFYVFLKDIGMK